MNTVYDFEIINFMLEQRIKFFTHMFFFYFIFETYRLLVNLDLLGRKMAEATSSIDAQPDGEQGSEKFLDFENFSKFYEVNTFCQIN